MRALIAILAGFAVGVLGYGSLLEWVLDSTAGPCPITGCEAWRTAVFYLTTGAVWIVAGRLTYLVMERIRPARPPSEFEQRLREVKRRGR